MPDKLEAMAEKVVESARDFMKSATAAIDKRLDGLEHRLVRRSEHLARLESRLEALERKADK